MKPLLILSLFIYLTIFIAVEAKDLGTHGRIYPIVEKDFLKVILGRAQGEVDSGKWNKRVERWKIKAIAKTNRPDGVILPRSETTESHLYDPSTVTPNDIRDTAGRLIHPAGTKVNPLTMVTMSKQLVFIDGDDRDQVNWMMEATKDVPEKYKVILANGPVIDLMNELNRRLYFDQNQKLVTELAIKKLPALVYQEGFYLRIDEVAIQ